MRTTLDVWARPGRSFWANSEVDRWFENLVSSPARAVTERDDAFRPACDFEETDSHYLFSMDVPGMRKEDLHIEVTGDTLTVQGERKSEARRADKGSTYLERSHGKFYRHFRFPVEVESSNVQAEYENGVLRIALTKAAMARPKKVEIRGDAGKPGLFDRLVGKKGESAA